MTPDYLDELARRVQQAFPDGDLTRAHNRYRAIVGPTTQEGTDAASAVEKLRNGRWPTAREIAALEKLIRMMRPVVFVQRGLAGELHRDVRPTFAQWEAFRNGLRPRASAIGVIRRIESDGTRSLVGTGFVVAPRLLMTNHHVVDGLTHGSGLLDPDSAVVDFEQEAEVLPEKTEVRIERVAAIHGKADLALLQIADTEADRPAVRFAEDAVQSGEAVAVVGYPGKDTVSNPLFVNALFGSQFGVKRAAPGGVLAVSEDLMFHDATTLKGNSGSPVFRIATGEVVAVHAGGKFVVRNRAVPGAIARAFAAEHAE